MLVLLTAGALVLAALWLFRNSPRADAARERAALFGVPLAYTGLIVAQERLGRWHGRLRGSPAPPAPEVAGGSDA
jgi:hypothetical protein